MKVKFWGVRGSIPAPGPHTQRYGGNTTCIEVRTDDDTLIILDAGTGIFPLAQELLKRLPVQANVFISHTHWDHIQGLPFFTPLYIPGNLIRIHGARDVVTGAGIEQVMEVQMQYSFFPIRAEQVAKNIEYVTLDPEVPLTVGSATITPFMMSHPVINFGYRIDCNGKSIFFTGDHEPWNNLYSPGDEEYAGFQQMVEMHQAKLDRVLSGIDVLIADSAYKSSEYPPKVGWGHGTMEGNIEWARRLGVKKLVCTHHEPTRSDADLETMFAEAMASTGGGGDTEVMLSREGLELVL